NRFVLPTVCQLLDDLEEVARRQLASRTLLARLGLTRSQSLHFGATDVDDQYGFRRTRPFEGFAPLARPVPNSRSVWGRAFTMGREGKNGGCSCHTYYYL